MNNYPILEKRMLAENIWSMTVLAPRVARAARPGQFVIVRAGETGERIPLTVADYDAERGCVTIVIQTIGVSTRKICALEVGEALTDFAGPLGHPSEFVTHPEAAEGRRYLSLRAVWVPLPFIRRSSGCTSAVCGPM